MLLRKQTKKWAMADGKKIRICDMEDSHLQNTIRFLENISERKLHEMQTFYLCCEGPSADMAQLSFDQAFDEVMEMDSSEFLPDIYYSMTDDLERREWNIGARRRALDANKRKILA